MLLNKQDWLHFSGWPVRYFDKAVAQSFPIKRRPLSRTDDWEIDSVAAIEWIVKQRLAAAGAASDERLDATDELARLRKEQADGQNLKNRVAQGELIPADEVVEGWQAAIGRARSLLLGLPPACADEIVLLSGQGPAAVRERLADLISGALDELRDTSLDEDGPESGRGLAA